MKNKLKWKKWNAYDGDGDEVWECPECEFDLLLSEGDPWDNEYYFCPKCGADLREKTKKKSKIKPCPFCGSKDVYVDINLPINIYVGKIQCLNCGANIKDVLGKNYKETEQRTIDFWNRRAK